MEFTSFEALVLALGSMGFGITLLIKGGDWTVDAAVHTAIKFGISPMLVGFTIVAIGTSFPELVVSILANMQGSGGIAIGNVIGSNIANVLLVIGMTSIFVTLQTTSKSLMRDLSMMMVATCIFAGLMLQGDIGPIAGLLMVVLLVGYIVLQYRMNKNNEEESQIDDGPEYKRFYEPYMYLALGLVGIAIGAELLVRGATVSADILGVPEAVIALSIIAFGTSLPELSTCIIAGRRGHSDIVIGNIIGSNVFNILMIIGVTSIVSPIAQSSYAAQLLNFDLWVMAAVSVIFAALLLFHKKVTKNIGIVFIGAYVAYNVYIYLLNMYNF